jgi:hypothetical protein
MGIGPAFLTCREVMFILQNFIFNVKETVHFFGNTYFRYHILRGSVPSLTTRNISVGIRENPCR